MRVQEKLYGGQGSVLGPTGELTALPESTSGFECCGGRLWPPPQEPRGHQNNNKLTKNRQRQNLVHEAIVFANQFAIQDQN